MRIIAIGALLLLCTATLAGLQQNGEALFQQGLLKQRGVSDYEGASQIYARILRDFPKDRALMAKTLIQLAECSEKLGRANEAREYYERVLGTYPDQATMFSTANKRLAALPFKPGAEGRIQVATPFTDDVTSFALSPDGKKFVFKATTDGKIQLWLRQLDSGKEAPIRGTENGASPFWKPDARSIGFFADRKLKRIGIDGGTAQVLADASDTSTDSASGTWSNKTDVIVFSPSYRGPLYRVPADGSKPAVAATVLGTALNHRVPQFLDDRHFLFFALGGGGHRIGSLDSQDSKVLNLKIGRAHV